jgi:hypothetical protein
VLVSFPVAACRISYREAVLPLIVRRTDSAEWRFSGSSVVLTGIDFMCDGRRPEGVIDLWSACRSVVLLPRRAVQRRTPASHVRTRWRRSQLSFCFFPSREPALKLPRDRGARDLLMGVMNMISVGVSSAFRFGVRRLCGAAFSPLELARSRDVPESFKPSGPRTDVYDWDRSG